MSEAKDAVGAEHQSGVSGGPLSGLKVVEIGVAMAGPFCTMTLGDYGADVIKIEKPVEGDDSRSWTPRFHDTLGYYFASANRNKRAVALDLKQPEGVEIAARLIDQADVLVHNFRPGVLERLGLGWEALSARNPRLIYCAISGFGASGPLSAKPANDLFMQAYSGGMSITGEPGGSPAKMGMSVADVGAGMFAVIGILMAIEARRQTGRGQRVDTSLLEGQIAMLAHFITRYFASGDVPGPSGSGALSSPIYRAYKGSDDWIVISAFNQRMWQGLCRALERQEWIEDPRFLDAGLRSTNRHLLIDMITAVIAPRTVAEWEERLVKEGVPCSPVNKIDRMVAEPQVAACQMIQDIDLPGLGPMRMAGLPVKLSASPGGVRRHPPRLGEHTAQVLEELGLSPSDVARLAASGVVGLDAGWLAPASTAQAAQ
ncbi:MAG: CoA transferase [Rhizobiales bacterium]|uniref:CaiB/BaiF CoA transferase family protein n=1 Tax=Aquabacter cavernae TaxID=2496029 RepID=UPI000F8EB0B2|nr:CoA transferase [Aquabacter cavernae]MBA4790216.1 CoA transferase [Hyphomicrobiales bacterium]